MNTSVEKRELLLLLMDIEVCSTVVNGWRKKIKSIKEIDFEIPLASPPQGYDPEVLDRHSLAVKWLLARVGRQLMLLRTRIHQNSHRNARRHLHEQGNPWTQSSTNTQFRFTPYLWILMLFICISPNSCSGTRTITHCNFDFIIKWTSWASHVL